MKFSRSDPDRRRVAFVGLAVWSFAVAVWLALLAPQMAPVRHGTAEDFWEIAFGVELERPEYGWGGHVLYGEGGWLVYDRTHLHGSDAFYVSVEDAGTRLDDALAAVEKVKQSGFRSPAVEAVEKWQAEGGRASDDLKGLIDEIHEAWRQRYIEKRPDLLPNHVEDEQRLVARWRRLKTFWATILFEWLLFTVLGAIAIRPWVRGLGPLGWTLHFAAIPLLFELPVYLGYSAHSFGGSFYGGILYPWVYVYSVIDRHRAVGSPFHTTFDVWVREHIPQVLEPISGPISSHFPPQCRSVPGPTEAVVFGILFGEIVGLCRWAAPRWQRLTVMLRPPNPS